MSKNTHGMFNNFLFEILTICNVMWRNTVEPGSPQTTIWRVQILCWVPKATNTNSEYVILIALPRQKWSHERASLLRLCLKLPDVLNIILINGEKNAARGSHAGPLFFVMLPAVQILKQNKMLNQTFYPRPSSWSSGQSL